MPKANKVLRSSEQLVLPKKSLLDRIADYLDSKEFTYRTFKESNYLDMQQRIDSVTVRVIMDVYEAEDWERIMFYIVFPIFVPENRRLEVLKKINDINYRLISGCFAIDMDDGEIRFRCTAESDSQLPPSLMDEMCRKGLNLSNLHFSEFMEIAFRSEDLKPKQLPESRSVTDTLQ